MTEPPAPPPSPDPGCSGGSGSESTAGGSLRLPVHPPFLALRRIGILAMVSGTTVGGAILMLGIMAGDGLTLLEALILTLFVPTFAWISLAFWNAVLGFALQLLRLDPLTLSRVSRSAKEGGASRAPPSADLGATTALVMPTFNEDPERVVAGLLATLEAVAATGHGDSFQAFLLSDTNDPAVAQAEEALVVGLPIHYRRRPSNEGRKAGNIWDFCQRWGGDYDFMVVLDADSLMAGDTLVELVRRMEANPDVGLLQTVPIPARQETPLGRFVQFAATLYSPMLAAGQAFWQGDAGNYWGHNAILRISPFLEHAHLPVLTGSPPLGGEILSHDFVEAALLRRAGWRVVLAPELGGSWEEVPGNLVDFAVRERRWAQGSLQHLRLLGMGGLHPVSRLHLLLGAVNYLASTLWLLILVLGSIYVLAPGRQGPVLVELPSTPGSWVGALLGANGGTGIGFSGQSGLGWLSLLGVTAIILFLPKGLGLVLGLIHRRREFGGTLPLSASVLVETLHSIVLAPVMMLWHTAFVAGVAGGRTVSWGPQIREGRAVGWREAIRRTGWMSALGLGWAGLIAAYAPLFLLWMSPILLGLVAAPILTRTSGLVSWGVGLRRMGLLQTPAERCPPPEHRLQEVPRPPSPPLIPSHTQHSGRTGVRPRNDRTPLPSPTP